MSDLRHRRSVQCAFEAGQELSLSHHNRIVEQLKTEILSELKTELSANFAKLMSSNSLTPKSAGLRQGGLRGSGRRLFENKPAPPGPQPIPPKHNTRNPDRTATAVNSVVAAGYERTVDDEDSRFWLYLSRVSRNVTEEQITRLAAERLGVEDIKVKRLVAKGKDVSRMRFISFKVGMQADLKHKALASTTWPDGLVFREFEERNAEFFWEPSVADVNTQKNPPSPILPKPKTSNLSPKSTPESTPKNSEQVSKDTEEVQENPAKETEPTSPAGYSVSPMEHQTE